MTKRFLLVQGDPIICTQEMEAKVADGIAQGVVYLDNRFEARTMAVDLPDPDIYECCCCCEPCEDEKEEGMGGFVYLGTTEDIRKEVNDQFGKFAAENFELNRENGKLRDANNTLRRIIEELQEGAETKDDLRCAIRDLQVENETYLKEIHRLREVVYNVTHTAADEERDRLLEQINTMASTNQMLHVENRNLRKKLERLQDTLNATDKEEGECNV